MKLFRRSKKDAKKELRDMLGDYEIQNFPGITMKVLGMLRDPDSSMTEIARQVQNDPAMLVKVLHTVNAAAYGLKVNPTFAIRPVKQENWG